MERPLVWRDVIVRPAAVRSGFRSGGKDATERVDVLSESTAGPIDRATLLARLQALERGTDLVRRRIGRVAAVPVVLAALEQLDVVFLLFDQS